MRALIVDDSATARQQARYALEDALETLGVDVDIVEAQNGVEALRLLASDDMALLVVDLHMPDIHGLEVLAFWRQRGGKKPRRAVVVSTEVSARDREKALEAGAHRFLAKPVGADDLAQAFGGLNDAVDGNDGSSGDAP
jgi:two-component system chemotaxis response regulator CheY